MSEYQRELKSGGKLETNNHNFTIITDGILLASVAVFANVPLYLLSVFEFHIRTKNAEFKFIFFLQEGTWWLKGRGTTPLTIVEVIRL